MSSNRHRRHAAGANIAEFGPALFLIFVFGIVPIVNLISFSISYSAASFLMRDVARAVSVAESREQGLQAAKSFEKRLRNPLVSFFQHVKLTDPAASNLQIAVSDSNGQVYSSPAARALPERFRPCFKDNVNKYGYHYQLTSALDIYPLLNLSGLPIIGQVPVIGGSTRVIMNTQTAVECWKSMDR